MYLSTMTPREIAGQAHLNRSQRERIGGHVLLGALAMYAVSTPFSLLLLKVRFEGATGQSLSWGDFFGAIQDAGLLAVFVFGIGTQVAFGVLAGVGAWNNYRHAKNLSGPMIALGIIAIAFSVLVFGGILGIVGGFLSITGGAVSRPVTRPVIEVPPPPGPPPMGPLRLE